MESNFDILKNYRDRQKVTPELVKEYCERVVHWLKDILGVSEL